MDVMAGGIYSKSLPPPPDSFENPKLAQREEFSRNVIFVEAFLAVVRTVVVEVGAVAVYNTPVCKPKRTCRKPPSNSWACAACKRFRVLEFRASDPQ